MAHEDDGDEPTPPPGAPLPGGSVPTGGFPAGGVEPAGPPSAMLTGAMRAPSTTDDAAPAGPPSVAVTGAFPARGGLDAATPRGPSGLVTAETELEPPSGVTAPTVIEPAPPVRRGTGRADRGTLNEELSDGGRPTGPPPVRDARPIEPAPAPARPSSSGGGGTLFAVLVCLASLAGIAYLLHRAFPELFARKGGATIQVTRPGAAEWIGDPAGVVVGARVTGLAGPARYALRGAGVDASGTTEVGADGTVSLAIGAVAEGVHDLELSIDGKTPAGEPAVASTRVHLQVDQTAPALELEAPSSAAAGPTSIVARVRDASPVQLACQVDGRLAWTQGVDPVAGGAAAVITRPVQLGAGRHIVRLEAMDGAGHVTSSERPVEVTAGPTTPTTPTTTSPPTTPSTTTPTTPATTTPTTTTPTTTTPTTTTPPTPRVAAPTLVASWPAGAVIGPGAVVDAQVIGATTLSVRIDGREVQTSLPWRLEAGAVADGPHVITLVAASDGGSREAERQVTVDCTPPVIEVEVAGDVEEAEVRGGVTDALDPAPRVSLRVDGGPPVVIPSLPHRLALRAGEHDVDVLARDAAGNLARRAYRVAVAAPSAPTPPPVVKVPADTVAPTIEVLSPAAPFIVREARVEVRLTDQSAIQAVVRLDGLEVRPERAEGQGAVTLTLGGLRLAEGDHELVVDASDPRGNRRQSTTHFLLDTVPPDLALVVTAGARPFQGTVELQARATDATSGVASVEARLPDGRVVPFEPGAGELLVARFDLPPGTYQVVVLARDRAGNEQAAGRPVTVEAPSAPAAVSIQLPRRTGTSLRIDGNAPAGSTVVVDANGTRLATTTSLPVIVSLSPGRYFVVVTVTPIGGAGQQTQGQVEVDGSGPTIRALRVTPLSRDRAVVEAEVVDQGPTTVHVLANGAQVANSLPCQVSLVLGKNEVVVVARDDVGNESRETRSIDVASPAPQPPPPPPKPPADPRETQVEELLTAGRPAEALPILNNWLSTLRSARGPLVLRARVHEALARQTQDPLERRNQLNEGINDMNRAIINFGEDVRSAHFRYRASLFQALGRRRAAEDDLEEAERLEASGR